MNISMAVVYQGSLCNIDLVIDDELMNAGTHSIDQKAIYIASELEAYFEAMLRKQPGSITQHRTKELDDAQYGNYTNEEVRSLILRLSLRLSPDDGEIFEGRNHLLNVESTDHTKVNISIPADAKVVK